MAKKYDWRKIETKLLKRLLHSNEVFLFLLLCQI